MKNSLANASTLKELLQGFVVVDKDVSVENIAIDHRQVVRGDLFIARSGVHHRADEYVISAINAGAVAVLIDIAECHACLKEYAEYIYPVNNLLLVAGEVISRFFGSPSRSISVIGITGTNGKTSCCHFIAQALNLLDEKTAYIGTIGTGFPEELEPSTHTTPDVLKVHQLLAKYKKAGAKTLVMEVSSHALDQGRTAGVVFSQVGFTNLTRDHLDYHENMAAYAATKQRLFEDTSAVQFLNIDDEFGKQLLTKANQGQRSVLTYSQFNQTADVYVKNAEFQLDGICFTLTTPWGEISATSSLIGRFNLSNLLLVTASLGLAGYLAVEISRAIAQVRAVTGRMEKVSYASEPLVLVDYAHTPDALLQTLSALNEHRQSGSQIICVFGCGGDRDQGKRPLMGQIASGLADQLVITSDNPRTEDPQFIIDQILEGVRSTSNLHIEIDRSLAIAVAINMATPTDIVLIAGKGHEDYQEIMGQRYPFSDQDVARKYLDQRSHV